MVHTIVVGGKSETHRADQQAMNLGWISMLQSQGKIPSPANSGVFFNVWPSSDWMKPIQIMQGNLLYLKIGNVKSYLQNTSIAISRLVLDHIAGHHSPRCWQTKFYQHTSRFFTIVKDLSQVICPISSKLKSLQWREIL